MTTAGPTSPTPGQPSTSRLRATRALGFSLLFALAGALVFWYLPLYHKSNVWWLDGMAQHFPALYFYNTIVRAFLHHPLAGIPQWTWNLGLGADTLGTLAFYVFDPFAIVSLVFPMHYLELAYLMLFFVRLFAAGALAYLYLRSMAAKPLAASAGSLMYVFTTFALFSAFRHPYFADPIVFFPLMLLGIERVLHGRRPYLLVLGVFLSAFSNFYFFYQLTFVAVLYAVVRYFELSSPEDRWKRFGSVAAKTAGFYLLGTALAAVSVVPVVLAVFGSSRAMGQHAIGLFASIGTYRSYLMSLMSSLPGTNSAYEGYPVLGFLLFPPLLMRRGRNLTIKVMIAAYFIFLAFPFFGSLFNGVSFLSYRFIFTWGIFLAAGAAVLLSDPKPFSRRELIAMLTSLLVYGALVLAFGTRHQALAASPALAIGLLTWATLAFESWAKQRADRSAKSHEDGPDKRLRGRAMGWFRYGVVALLVLNIAANGAVLYSRHGANYLKRFEPLGGVLHLFQVNAGSLAAGLPGDGFFRVDKQRDARGSDLGVTASNDPLVQGYDGTSFYYSVLNAGVSEYLRKLDNRPMRLSFDFNGFDERAALLTLNAVKYYIAPNAGAAYVPYGFAPFARSGASTVYENRYALPLGYVYHSGVSRAQYDAMTPLERQQTLLQSAVLDTGTPVSLPAAASRLPVLDLPFSVTPTKAVEIDTANHRFRTLALSRKLELHFNAVPDSELYVDFVGFTYRKESPKARNLPLPQPSTSAAARAEYWKADGKVVQPQTITLVYDTGGARKTERNESPSNNYFWGDQSQLVNLGYSAEGTTAAFVRPTLAGVYTYQALKVYAVPMKGYAESVAALREESLHDVHVNGDDVRANFSAKRDGLLFLSVPYSSGWRATIDGRSASVVRANLGFIGIPVRAGSHQLTLRYSTPGLGVGAGVSAVAFVLALVLLGGGVVVARKRAGGSVDSSEGASADAAEIV